MGASMANGPAPQRRTARLSREAQADFDALVREGRGWQRVADLLESTVTTVQKLEHGGGAGAGAVERIATRLALLKQKGRLT